MFDYIPTILRSQEIINKSFKRASNIEEPYFPRKEDKIKKEIMDRISTIESTACSHFDRIIKKFPTIEKIHPFYYHLIDLMFDVDHYKLSLGKVQWTSDNIKRLSTDYIKKLRYAKTINEMNVLMKSYYGRFSSLVKNINDDLVFLGNCRDSMRRLPGIITDMPTFIMAGMPNAGKSSLISKITDVRPKIAPYPFTTLDIIIGYRSFKSGKAQFIDTPGLLDRDMSRRNDMEKKAIIALSYIDGIILFLFDYSGQVDLDAQARLYSEIRENFPNRIIRVQTKLDLSKRYEDIAVSAVTGDGMDHFMEFIEGEVGEYYRRNKKAGN
ncbi:NOG1 family protein [Picrophilus oshimae]|uniref:GTP-binding protein n=1 Tax=Picrophilus torridus (strain ATCC 700027 / DSM 9790 / JCM 10055 / NBRC 100828 / KAW 2/3) TaxID=1122961 RepID=Q6L0N8_PICTO|nr:GTPase [Picrophilus oshimae]AAT43464.1 GTP-binding protein [Picrophilus oshimae DSM 9789]